MIKSDSWKNDVSKSYVIKQGFLNSSKERTVRVRIKDAQSFLTIKSKVSGITRSEFEYEIPIVDAEQLLDICEKPLIEKTRFEVIVNDFVWEIDVFEGLNLGLEVAEIEIEDELQVFELPNWVGEEVTQDFRYYNSNLVDNPFCKW